MYRYKRKCTQRKNSSKINYKEKTKREKDFTYTAFSDLKDSTA